MKVLYVGFRWIHHAKNGGYDWITHYPDSDYFDARKIPFFGKRLMEKSGGRLALDFTNLKTFFVSRKYEIIHFFHADHLAISRRFISKRSKLFATVHLKTEDFSERKIELLKRYNAVICLSNSESSFLNSKGVNAVFIPHGFNAPVFEKKTLTKYGFDASKLNVCLLGYNYRDFDMFENAVMKMAESRPDIVFHAVGQRAEEKKRFEKYKNVIIYPYLDDDEYYSLIQACDYNFLPVTFATANNVVMEAQALGTVSILPRISGIIDYAEQSENLFYENAENCLSLFKNLEKKSKSVLLKEFAKSFEWQKIYDELTKLYKEA